MIKSLSLLIFGNLIDRIISSHHLGDSESEGLETRGILVGITEVVDEDAPADEETAA